MKRTILSLFVMMLAAVAWADNVTAQQALQQAQKFMQQRETVGNRPKRAKGSAATQMTMAKQVSGLYVFNIKDNGGFVIVSNDDCVRPILGFSDSGSLDPDNMPSNMKAWLQGYADEIAWAKEHNVKKTLRARIAPTASTAQASPRAHSTAAIEPLVKAHWNQDTPFNDLCPNYTSTVHCASGCVATAMAQVMYYHKWPQVATEVIPQYYCPEWGSYMDELPSTTFDWANMIDDYPYHWTWTGSQYVKVSDCTAAQGTAVATLMKYCGFSVEMSYGEESGAYSYMVANALKNYFDYNTETTKNISRSSYNATKWADIIYHELANNRPVVYGGQSSGGGHEFVCDGYMYESSTDFFHINWGWGGMSDDYFVLSALDPDAQGIGGSTSTDGFRYSQDANIGIQPSTKSGTTADLTPITIDLKLNSMTMSSNPAPRYEPMTFILNITNNSSDDYDGEISIGSKSGTYYNIFVSDFCPIKAGETKDFEIRYIPTKAGTFTILPFDGTGYSMTGSSPITFTVIDASRSDFVPIYGGKCDEGVRSQFIIPAADLEEMAHSSLNSMTFYASTLSPISWGDAEFDVYLKEVSETTISSLQDWNTMEKVYSGSLSVGSDGKMVVTFTDPYPYGDSNLLVGFNQTQTGTWASTYWLGTEVTGVSMGGSMITTYQRDFLPRTTFDYTPGANATPKPTDVTVVPSQTSAKVTWKGGEYATGYNLQYRTAAKDATVFYDSFEDGLDNWTVIRNSGGNQYTDWRVVTSATCFNSNPITAHDGEKVAMSRSWSNTAYDVDNWLITPQVTLKGTLKFWVLDDGSYHEHYDVYVSTTTNDIASFTKIYEPGNASSSWTEVTVDLSSYGGQKGYIALRHTDNDQDFLFIDDFGIYAEAAPAGEWQNVSTTQPYKVLTGLAPLTTYELQVQGVYPGGTSAWTNTITFATSDILLGDANGDGQVTITDAVGIVNKILGNPSAGFNEAAADVNGDGQITITDAVGVVNIILNSGASAPPMDMKEPEKLPE